MNARRLAPALSPLLVFIIIAAGCGLRREPPAPVEPTAPVTDSRWLGAVHELVVDVGVPLVVTISSQEQRCLGCEVGDRVCVGVDAEEVRVLTDP